MSRNRAGYRESVIGTSSTPIRCTFSCCVAASSNAHPLEMLCAAAGDNPAPCSSSDEARKIARGDRKISTSCPALRVPTPADIRKASQWSDSSELSVGCMILCVETPPEFSCAERLLKKSYTPLPAVAAQNGPLHKISRLPSRDHRERKFWRLYQHPANLESI